MRVEIFALARGARACVESAQFVVVTRLAGLLTEICCNVCWSVNVSQVGGGSNVESASFQALVILLHSLGVLASGVHSGDVEGANCFRFFCKVLSKLCWGHVPCGDVMFFGSWGGADWLLCMIPVQ